MIWAACFIPASVKGTSFTNGSPNAVQKFQRQKIIDSMRQLILYLKALHALLLISTCKTGCLILLEISEYPVLLRWGRAKCHF